jgi:hypothetical protein
MGKIKTIILTMINVIVIIFFMAMVMIMYNCCGHVHNQ